MAVLNGFVELPIKDAELGDISVNINLITDIRVVTYLPNKWVIQVIVTPGTKYTLDLGPFNTKSEALSAKRALISSFNEAEVEIPEMHFVDPIVTQDSITLSLDIIDPHKVGSITSVELYNGAQLVESLTDFDTIKFENLLSDTTYTVKATYSYSIKGTIKTIYDTVDISTDITTLAKEAPVVSISNITSNTESVDFNINVVDIDSTFIEVTDIELYKDDILVEALVDFDTTKFENLLSDTTYRLKVTYSYDLNNGAGLQSGSVSEDITTLAKTAPVVNISNITSTTESIEFNIDIVDTDSTFIEVTDIELYKDDILVEALVDFDTTKFENLLSDTTYRLKVTYSYDLNNGAGLQSGSVSEDITTLAKTAPVVNISNITSTTESIEFNIDIVDTDSTFIEVTDIELYKDDILVEALVDFDTTKFENLLSDTTYRLKVTYSYDLNNGAGLQSGSVSEDITTLAKTAPVVNISNITSTTESIEFNIDIVDTDSTFIEVTDIELYKDDILVEALVDFDTTKFENLLSDTTYRLKVTYSYDLNNGAGLQSGSVSEDITTLAKTAPVVNISNITSTTESIEFNIDIVDTDSTFIEVTDIELYKDDILVEALVDFDTTKFENLLSDTTYRLKVTYSYDLNNGAGLQSGSVSEDITTLAKTAPVVNISNITSTTESIEFNIDIVDTDSTFIEVTDIELYKDDILVEALVDFDTTKFENLLSDTTYRLKVTYSYDLNNGAGLQSGSVSEDITTLAKTAPVVNISNITSTTESIEFNIDIVDTDSTFIEVTDIELYKDDILVEALVDFDTTKFENLLSDTTYRLKVTYSYDLNNGAGLQSGSVSEDITTLAKTAPVVNISNITSTTESIEFNIDIVDTDSTFIEVTDIELYKDDILVEALVDFDTTKFENLLSDTTYRLKVTYSYDLNNGAGLQSGSVSEDITTLAKTAPVAVITDVVPTATTIEFDYTITDPTNSLVSHSLQIIDPDNVITTLPSNDLRIFEGLMSDTAYTLRVFMTYDLNDGTGEQTTFVTFDTATLAE